MLSLINLLVLFFIILIIYQIFLAYIQNNIVEGLTNSEYQPYDTNNPQNALILAQQNAGNISFLKQQIDEVSGLNKEVQDISGNVVALQEQVNGLVSAQKQYADQMTGGSPPNVTGLGSTDESQDTSNLVTS
jgi:hypothetical protein